MTVALLAGAQDLAETRATLNQLIEEFNAAIAAGGGGVTFPLTAPDNAIAINGSDATSGFSFDAAGVPGLDNAGRLVQTTSTGEADLVIQAPGLSIIGLASDGLGGLNITGPVGAPWEPYLVMTGFGNGYEPEIYLASARGTRGTPVALSDGDRIGRLNFVPYLSDNSWGNPVVAITVDEFGAGTQSTYGGKVTINTLIAATPGDRLVIDGSGNTKQQNGVFAFDTGGNDSGIAIGSLPGSPTLGMMAVVNDALAPAVGVVVAATGSAKALVWWNGAQWTVVGI